VNGSDDKRLIKRGNGTELNEVIDETETDSASVPSEPTKVPTNLRLLSYRTFGDISKLFIILSLALVAVTILIGIWNVDFSLKVLTMLWDKISAVYLVIFGNFLSKR
jgi:hypothetical protein